MASLNTYRAYVLVKAMREWAGEKTGQRRRYLALRSDGYILRRDSAYTPQGWRSPGWKLFRKRKESATWPEFARDFLLRLTNHGYRITFLANGASLSDHGFSPQMRLEAQNLKRLPQGSVKDDEADRPGGAVAEVKSREKSRYRLYVCARCGQKIRAATDQLQATHSPCGTSFIRKD